MKLKLIRHQQDDKQTLGKLFDGDKLLAHTLELSWKDNQRKVSCIPASCYKVVKRNSPKYGDHFHILDVPNRDFILIHHGNYHIDILGCILVGQAHIDIDGDGFKDVTASKAKMAELNSILPDSFELEIVYKV
jgi:hypothetical protein